MNEDTRINTILCSFLTISDRSLSRESEEIQIAISNLMAAIVAEDWGSIAKAANALIPHKPSKSSSVSKHSRRKRDILELATRGLALDVFKNPQKYGLSANKKPVKADIIAVIEAKYPILLSILPTSPRGMTDWWKRVSREIEQARGNASSEVNRLIRQSARK